ncbi:MAG TPA: glycoside hydrolase family 97 protein [Bacteroidales bacterium]|nr:glycoside hydrolase family 97 protein [Bacteroidales bacterium]HPT20687.1 glycoside hydrolase family 97 protein [Bacteroidales bacterium]
MRKIVLAISLFIVTAGFSFGKDYKVNSPDGKISMTVNVGSEIKWSATLNGKEIVNSPKIAMVLADGRVLGENEKVKKFKVSQHNEIIKPVVANKRSEITDNCNILTISFNSGFSLQFRAYNDGVAYRFETSMKDEITVKNEISGLQFPSGAHSWYPLEAGFMSHNERTFIYSSLDTITDKHLASLPALFQVNGANLLVTESDIIDYPGMWLTGAGSGKINSVWPKYPNGEKLSSDRDLHVTGTKDYIAKTAGTRAFPWRTYVIAENDVKLLESDLVFKLASPNKIEDTKWIKPGQVAWDWWNANNIYGVDFNAGINNETYKYYIDFASKNGIEYVILDEGWYKLGNVLEQVPEINVPELCKYAESKNVGVILWVVWKTLDDQIDKALDQYEEWGVKGIKVDFMQRDDQPVVNFYHEATKKAAEHHMLIDFHGAYKPDGLGRTYPNAITREGVKGLENDKWSKDISPDHDVTIPFTRMVAGPMDYTPGAMINMERSNFNPQFTRPTSQGTRAHQVALYVIYESPLQMLSDSPSNYMKEQETTDFIVNIPVVWDDIIGIDGKVGDYLLVARRSGKEWFVGAITDWTARDMDLNLSFLPEGEYVMEVFRDGVNADKYAGDYKHLTMNVKSGDKMKIHLAPGGGYAARISPKK